MSSIALQREHGLGQEGALDVARRLAQELESGYGMRCEWQGDVLRFERTGVSGEMTVSPDRIELNAELGFLLSAFKERIEDQLNRNFETYFGPPAAR
jgi:putative polyhydroxyalkanoate system protein